MTKLRKHIWALRFLVLAACVAMVASASVLLVVKKTQDSDVISSNADAANGEAVADVEENLIPPHRDPPPPPPPPPPAPVAAKAPVKNPAPSPARATQVAPKPKAPPKPAPAPKPAAAAAGPLPGAADVYRGQGTWMDIFDNNSPAATTEQMQARGVRTLYFQTSRFKQAEDIFNPDRLGAFIDASHARGIAVVCWYVPGFGDMGRDIRRSMMAIEFTSPKGGHCDGFAPDIETMEESLGGDRGRFNAGIIEYSRQLRAAAGGRVLGAIVVDAKNNTRAPVKWAGFPWPEIGQIYDVVMPMAYWSVTKGANCALEYDVGAYMREVVSRTKELMGVNKPLHLIGGIGNCMTAAETTGFVNALLDMGVMGGSIYDFETVQANPNKDFIWSETARLNR